VVFVLQEGDVAATVANLVFYNYQFLKTAIDRHGPRDLRA
jgi:hypothetical protein